MRAQNPPAATTEVVNKVEPLTISPGESLSVTVSEDVSGREIALFIDDAAIAGVKGEVSKTVVKFNLEHASQPSPGKHRVSAGPVGGKAWPGGAIVQFNPAPAEVTGWSRMPSS